MNIKTNMGGKLQSSQYPTYEKFVLLIQCYHASGYCVDSFEHQVL
jgi:hypothetical protein